MTALNGRNEGKWQLGLIQSCASTGEKEALTIGLHHRLSWRSTLHPAGCVAAPLSLYPLNTTSTLLPNCDNQRCLQIFPNVP